MEFTVLPGLSGVDATSLWFGVASTQCPPPIRLTVAGRSLTLAARNWVHLAGYDEDVPFWFRRQTIDDLAPGGLYKVRAVLGSAADAPLAEAAFRTLPARLPVVGVGMPLRIHLSSCFFLPNGRATALRSRAGTDDPPHLKLLAGDQVYVDWPPFKLPRSFAATFRDWLAKYEANWSLHAGDFASLLRNGSNLFISDDHEFWNNAPGIPIYQPAWYSPEWRDTAFKLGQQLFDTFQNGSALTGLQAVDIGPTGAPELALRALDCRLFRDDATFARTDDIAEVCQWLRTLRCPGLLVLSQPLLEPAANVFVRNIIDAGLADYTEPFGELVAALRAAPHDVMILSGDIHCGRISSVVLTGGRRIWEVVSSPRALVARGYHDEGPVERFLGQKLINHSPLIREDHHAILTFARQGPAVEFHVRYESLATSAPRPLFVHSGKLT